MRLWFVAALVTVTVTPGITAPLSSVTTPAIAAGGLRQRLRRAPSSDQPDRYQER